MAVRCAPAAMWVAVCCIVSHATRRTRSCNQREPRWPELRATSTQAAAALIFAGEVTMRRNKHGGEGREMRWLTVRWEESSGRPERSRRRRIAQW